MHEISIGIIGLGLIGGSLAKALRRAGYRDVRVYGPDSSEILSAMRDGVVSGEFSPGSGDMPELIFLCAPPDACLSLLGELSGRCGALITDVCSVKSGIVELSYSLPGRFRFVGGHPMAGSEKAGYANSSETLFENACYVLCPGKNSGDAELSLLSFVVSSIGAIPFAMDPREHDRAVAAISHLPHLVAYALSHLVSDLDQSGHMRALASGGFRDMTRIASSRPRLWREIILGNRSEALPMLDAYISELMKIRGMISLGEAESLEAYMGEAAGFRVLLSESGGLLSNPYSDMLVDIRDTPGQISKISGLLADAGINIKNMVIQNSREGDGGALRVSLTSRSEAESAAKLLRSRGINTEIV